VIEVQFRQVAGHEVGGGEAGIGIFLSPAGDGAGGADSIAYGLGAEVGGTGGALALAEIDGDAETVVTGMLHRLHLAQADTDLQAGLGTGGGLGGAGALVGGLRQQIAHDALQPSMRKVGWPTPTGTLCPSLPHTPTPSSSLRSLPIIETCLSTSEPAPMRVAPLTGRVILPSSIR
jgi:hypothetical protein